MREQPTLQLQYEWEQLLHHYGVKQVEAQATFMGLSQAYNGPGRVYHTLEHIQTVLMWIDRLRDYAVDLPALQLAAWFHDSIYDTHASDNEEQSAGYAQRVLSHFTLPTQTINAVSQMVLCTKTHRIEGASSDCAILLDADLAILGVSGHAYDEYAQAIRQEYQWVSEPTYRTARVQILQIFLQRAKIYQTEHMYTTLEEQARKNILREIAALS